MTNEFRSWIKDFIYDELVEWEGSDVYMSELAYNLTEEINVNGAYFGSTQQAEDFIKEYFDDAAETFEYYNDELGMVVNPFENPDKYQILMIIYGVEEVLSESKTVQAMWDNEVTLDTEIINNILNDLGIER